MDISVLQHLGPALLHLLTGPHLLYLLVGVVVGLTVGLLPGLGGISGMALILPFLYGLEPGAALAMMIGLTSVINTSDTFPSILLGIPGSSSAQATVIDGFAMSRKGEAARALGASFSASLIGGLFGAFVLTFAVFAARPIILAIGFGEQLLLVVLALTLVGMLTGASALKGLVACGFGLLIGTVGAAPATAEYRLTFGSLYLTDGIPLVLIGLGIFAIPEILDVLRHQRAIAEKGTLGAGWTQGFKDTIRNRWLVLRCSGIGALIGALPGLGGSVIDWLAYGHAVQSTRNRDEFGKGDVRGVIAPESANNAKEGGALVPTLLFGIPGSGSMALLLGGLVVIGITPGRSMVQENIDLTYLIIWSIAFANIFGAAICLALARPVALLTTIRYTLIAPFMIVLIFFAAYQASRDWGDFLVLLAAGVLGVYLKRFGWSRPAFLIGFVLSQQLEESFYRTVQVYGFDFLTRPVSLGLLALCLISAFLAWRNKVMIEERTDQGVEQRLSWSIRQRMPQLAFCAFILACLVVAFFDIVDLRFLGNLFPLTVIGLTGAGIVAIMVNLLGSKPSPRLLWDAELTSPATSAGGRGIAFWLLCFAGLLILSSITGFAIAGPVFVFLFLLLLARASLRLSLVGAVAVAVLLALMGNLLVLEYPQGVLQSYIQLPWPFA